MESKGRHIGLQILKRHAQHTVSGPGNSKIQSEVVDLLTFGEAGKASISSPELK
jgi:hypothetical protein